MEIDMKSKVKTFSLKDLGIEDDKDYPFSSEIKMDFDIVKYNLKKIPLSLLTNSKDISPKTGGISKKKTWDALKTEIEYLERVSWLVNNNKKIDGLVLKMINAKEHLIRLMSLAKSIYGEDKISIELSPKMYDFISESFDGEYNFKDFLSKNNISIKMM